MSDPETNSKVKACDRCRRRHRACDLAEPQCGLCRMNGLTCRRSSRQFRFKRVMPGLGFSGAERWTATPARVDFVDETDSTIRGYDAETNPEPAPAVLAEPKEVASHNLVSSRLPEPFLFSSETISHSGVSEPSSTTMRAPWTPPELTIGDTPSTHANSPIGHTPTSDIFPSDFGHMPLACESAEKPWSMLSASDRRWALQDPTEVLLLDHFINELSGFFDFCDQQRHFAVEVPQRARNCPLLLDAILALSARHLSRIRNDLDPYLADRYYQRCLESLIPELDRVAPTCVDDLLTATVILRLLEELDVPLAGLDSYQHSTGTRALLCSQTSRVPCATGLRRAASWSGLRQEVWVCLSMHKPPAMRASAELLDYLDPQQDDCAWAHRAVSHCLDVLDFCFGDVSGTVAAYDVLLGSNIRWEADRPSSYDPLCCITRTHGTGDGHEDPFWAVPLQLPWHVMGWQYRTLARLLLITHDPKVPRLGLGRQSALRKMNGEARSAVKLACSIAESNPSVPAAMVIAFMAIRICGDLFESSAERQAVVNLLARLEVRQGWPTLELRTNLHEVWRDSLGGAPLRGR